MKKYRINYKNTNLDAPEGNFLIGRSSECHLILDDPSVSRIHAVIVRQGDVLRVEDKGSRNGVLVNKEKIVESRILQDGDQILIGHQIIRITVAPELNRIEGTQAIMRCKACGAWVAGDVSSCSVCGVSFSCPADFAGQDNTEVQTAKDNRPNFTMLLELALKAIQVGKLEEADRLISGIYSSAETRLNAGDPIMEGDITRISEVLIALAQQSRSVKDISRVFSLHLAGKKLMTRELVEKLYDLVRPVGYLACADMTKYLTFLDSKAQSFNPGELFVHRRIQGLLKLCS